MIIGAGWKKVDKNNDTYLSIQIDIPLLGQLRLLLYPNKNKKSENSPDYEVRWLPERPQKDYVPMASDDEEVPF